MNKTAECQHDKAEDLKELVQEFTENVLELADNPPSSPPSTGSSRYDHGHGTSFFSSGGQRHIEPRHGGYNFAESSPSASFSPLYEGGYNGRSRMERFRGAYVDKDEELVPAVLYIAGAGIIGSFLARRSNFVFRFLSPIALALGAAAYTVPKTTNNLIYGLKHYDYGEMNREWHHKWNHARKSVTDATHDIQSGLTSVVEGTKDAVHDLSDKSHELTDKAQHALHDVQEKSVDIAHEVKDKGAAAVKTVEHKYENAKDEVQDGAKQAKHWLRSAERNVENGAKDLKKNVQEQGEHAKHWWRSAEHDAEKQARDFKRSAEETGDNARDWLKDQGRRWQRESSNNNNSYGRDEVERRFEKFKNKARENWDETRDDVENRGRNLRSKFEESRVQGQKWARDGSNEAQSHLREFGDQGQEWAGERRRDFRHAGRELSDRFEDAKRDAKRFGRDARDYGEDRFQDARRDIRNRVEDAGDRGRRQVGRFEHEIDRSWGHGRRERDDYEGSGRRFGGEDRQMYGRGEQYDNEPPRRSVTDAAKEGHHWWQHKNAADPYESFDRERPSTSSSPWWTSGSSSSSADQTKNKMTEEFDNFGRHAKRNAEDLRDRVEDKAEEGRRWLANKTHNLKERFEYENNNNNSMQPSKRGERLNGYREEQGRDFGGSGFHGPPTHDHSSIYSGDYWFHRDNDAYAPHHGQRGGDRGM
ncbi:hypothetical protein BG004_000643 [Podila humilis]|nr:hypothetical protein BG004_000643 [Podila humilis]